MQSQDVRVTIRVNRELKENAETLFEYLGLNMSNAVNIFLRKAVDQRGIPFPVNSGNYEMNLRPSAANPIGGLYAAEVTATFNNAVKQAIETKKEKGIPIARYDMESEQAYLENSDGSREYV